MTRKRAFVVVLCVLGGAVGCGHSADTPPPPTPDAFSKHIQNNPNMSAEQKAEMLQKIGSHQQEGQAAGAARQKREGKH